MPSLTIPPVVLIHLQFMYQLFDFSDSNCSLRYIEPQFSLFGKTFWKIEYKLFQSRRLSQSDMAHFLSVLQRRIGDFTVFDMTSNFNNRVYLFVEPTALTTSQDEQVLLVPEYRRRSKSTKQRDGERAQLFKDKIKAVTDMVKENIQEFDDTFKSPKSSEPVTQKIGKLVSFIERNINKKRAQKSPQNPNSKEEIKKEYSKFVPGPVQLPAPRPDGLINPKPIAKLTAVSVKSDDKMYALSRFNEPEVFDLVRMYLAYLSTAGEGTVAGNETKLSAEMKIRSHGLPIGKELHELYCKYMQSRGCDKDRVDADLEGIRSYEATQRLVRMQTAREMTKKWYGLKGGQSGYVNVVEQEYHRITYDHQGMVKIVKIADESGELIRFN